MLIKAIKSNSCCVSVCRVDTDGDGRLCAPELEAWIRKKTEEHFDEGIDESNHVFKHLDPDGDGTVYTVNKLLLGHVCKICVVLIYKHLTFNLIWYNNSCALLYNHWRYTYCSLSLFSKKWFTVLNNSVCIWVCVCMTNWRIDNLFVGQKAGKFVMS